MCTPIARPALGLLTTFKQIGLLPGGSRPIRRGAHLPSAENPIPAKRDEQKTYLCKEQGAISSG